MESVYVLLQSTNFSLLMIWTVADVDNVKSNAPNVDYYKTYFGDKKYPFSTLSSSQTVRKLLNPRQLVK